MQITVAKIPPHLESSVRTLVSDPGHQVALATGLIPKSPNQPLFGGQLLYRDLGLVATGQSLLAAVQTPSNEVDSAGPSKDGAAPSREDVKKLYTVIQKGVWPIAKEAFPLNNTAIEGIEIVFAGQKLWSRITSGEGSDKIQVALAATDFGLELYDLISKFYPALQVASPGRKLAGVLINGVDVTYGVYFTNGKK